TRPEATSSASASSTCGRNSPVPSTSSSKNEAPYCRMKSATACAFELHETASAGTDSAAQSVAWRRARNVIGVVRPGAGLRPPPAHRVAVDAGQQPALAPLLRCRICSETSAQRETFSFERCERSRYVLRLPSERRGQRICSGRPQSLEAAANDFDQGLLRRPFALGTLGRRGNRRVEPCCGPQCPELRQALGGDPQGRL